MKSYLDIAVVISPGTTEGAYAVRIASGQGGQVNSTLRLPFTLGDLAGTVFGVAQTARAISSHTLEGAGRGVANGSRKNAADFGVELFQALFQDEAREALVATESKARSLPDTGVRIRLSMDLRSPGIAKVAGLPWELMCRRGDDPLALSTQTTLVRDLDVPGSTEPRPFRAPLRILVVMSNPKGTVALDLDRERAQIQDSWGGWRSVQVDFVRAVGTEIRRKLAEEEYHVIHYMGHGDFDSDEGGTLLLEDEQGNPDPVTGDKFALWLKDEPLRLVFLNACKSGTTGARSGLHPFAGVAAALINKRVPAVVAMQFPISDQAALRFAKTFYALIVKGIPVDAAVVAGRVELYSFPDTASEWVTPVLYLRSNDGMLFPSAGDDAAAGQAAGAAAATAAAAEDPWGPGAGSAFRVFLAAPDQDRERLHAQLSKALREMEGVCVVDSVPLDGQNHDRAVDSLVRRADLCVHLLGAHPGKRLDLKDGQPLRTYPLVQLEIASKAARSQLVVMTSEDEESIDNVEYRARVDELARQPRDKEGFELVITDRNRITEAVKAKIVELKRARQAAPAPGAVGGAVRTAFVDSHEVDQDSANELVTFLSDREVEAFMQTDDSAATSELAQFGDRLRQYPLYILVAGKADAAWVKNRTNAARTSAVRSRAAILIGKYESGVDTQITMSRLKVVAAIKRPAPDSVEALFAPATGDKS